MLNFSRACACCAIFAAAISAARAESAFITRLVPPADGTYNRTLVLQFTAVFNVPVNVSGSPRLPLTVGGVSRYATWNAPLSAGPLSALVFEYSPQPYDEAPGGLVVAASLDLNGGAIAALDGSTADVAFSVPNTRQVRVALLLPPSPRILAVAFRPGTATDAEALLLSGSADGTSVVTVQRAQAGVIGQVLAEENGAWTLVYPVSGVAAAYQFTATALNRDGLESIPSPPLTVVVADQSATLRVVPGARRDAAER